MNLESFNVALTAISVLITVFGILILYFGRIMLKSRKEMTKDLTSQTINGTLFLADYIIIPGLTVYIILSITFKYIIPLILYNQGINCLEICKIAFGALLIFIQYKIFIYYNNTISSKTNKTKRWEKTKNWIFSTYIIIIALIFIKIENWFYLVSSLILGFLIYTYMAAIDHFRNQENDNTGKSLKIKIEEAGKVKTIEAEIKRLGNDFIDVIINNKEITINKNNIISIEK